MKLSSENLDSPLFMPESKTALSVTDTFRVSAYRSYTASVYLTSAVGGGHHITLSKNDACFIMRI